MDQPAAPNINILSFKAEETSGVGKFLTWSLRYGRIIIIITELVVIGAFVSRFYFDSKLSDLHDQITGKTNLIEQAQTSQDQFLALQNQITQTGKILDSQRDFSVFLANVNNLKPSDVFFTQMAVKEAEFSFTAQVPSVGSMNIFLQNLNTSDKFSDASLDSISVKDGQYIVVGRATVQPSAYQ